jgi:hypothetical protein
MQTPAQPVQKAQKARITPQTTLNMEKLCKDQAALRIRNISSPFFSTALLANCYRADHVKLAKHFANLTDCSTRSKSAKSTYYAANYAEYGKIMQGSGGVTLHRPAAAPPGQIRNISSPFFSTALLANCYRADHVKPRSKSAKSTYYAANYAEYGKIMQGSGGVTLQHRHPSRRRQSAAADQQQRRQGRYEIFHHHFSQPPC